MYLSSLCGLFAIRLPGLSPLTLALSPLGRGDKRMMAGWVGSQHLVDWTSCRMGRKEERWERWRWRGWWLGCWWGRRRARGRRLRRRLRISVRDSSLRHSLIRKVASIFMMRFRMAFLPLNFQNSEFGGGQFITGGEVVTGALPSWTADFGFTADLPMAANRVSVDVTYPGHEDTSLLSLNGFDSSGRLVAQQTALTPPRLIHSTLQTITSTGFDIATDPG